jgi:hypothetical protein
LFEEKDLIFHKFQLSVEAATLIQSAMQLEMEFVAFEFVLGIQQLNL